MGTRWRQNVSILATSERSTLAIRLEKGCSPIWSSKNRAIVAVVDVACRAELAGSNSDDSRGPADPRASLWPILLPPSRFSPEGYAMSWLEL